jgi:hypothetical protein
MFLVKSLFSNGSNNDCNFLSYEHTSNLLSVLFFLKITLIVATGTLVYKNHRSKK